MNANIKSIGLGILFITATAFGNQAGAADLAGGTPQVRVTFADLNLDQPAGAATLYARIAGAAATVCPEAGSRDILNQLRRKACIAEAIQRAVASVSAPQLTRYYTAKTGKSPDLPALAARK